MPQRRLTHLGTALVFLVACGGPAAPAAVPTAATREPSGPTTDGPPKAPPVDVFAVPATPRDDESSERPTAAIRLDAWQNGRKAKGVPAPPASCAPWASRPASRDPATILAAYLEQDPAKRDAMFVAAATAKDANVVAIRAQRAELAPTECADAILDPLLESIAKTTPASAKPEDGGDLRVAIGLSIAGKLARTALAPPAMGAARDKEKVKAFVQGPLKGWLTEQSTAIEVLSSGAAGLSGYARGVAAIEAGIADLRLVDKMRSSPVPSTWDPELKAVYEAALDEALEPRKTRGRDAALVGMGDLARAGVLRDTRLDRARTLLTKLYGGRRIDALDGLLLPAPAKPAAQNETEKALDVIPPYWLETAAAAIAPDASPLGSHPRSLARGVSPSVRDLFRTKPKADGDLGSQYARARLDMGRVYWRRVDFVEAAHAAKGQSPDDRLVLALALALARGPNGAAEMMRAPTPAGLDLGHTEALDALAAEGGPLAGLAAYDAAHLRALSPPEGAAGTAWLRDVATRFRKAETLLVDPAQKQGAAQRAADIDAILATQK